MNLASHRRLDRVTVISVAGEVDATSSARLETYIDDVRPRLDEHLIIDAGRLVFLDSSGLSVLVAAAANARVHGAGLHLAALQPRVARLLAITGAWRVMSVYDHVEQAVAAVEAIIGPQPPETVRPAEPV
ncbi:STAS domain-containing protein [Nonomuraea sp. NPDC002799]